MSELFWNLVIACGIVLAAIVLALLVFILIYFVLRAGDLLGKKK